MLFWATNVTDVHNETLISLHLQGAPIRVGDQTLSPGKSALVQLDSGQVADLQRLVGLGALTLKTPTVGQRLSGLQLPEPAAAEPEPAVAAPKNGLKRTQESGT